MHLIVSIISVSTILVLYKGEAVADELASLCWGAQRFSYGTYSRLEEERGAGMSQRTRRP